MKSAEFCDECGYPLPIAKAHIVPSLPRGIHSANKGESAILCGECFVEVMTSDSISTKKEYPNVYY